MNRLRKTTWTGSGWTASHILWSLLNGLLGREEERVWSRSTLYIAAGTLQRWSQTTPPVCAHKDTSLPAFLHPNIQSQHEAKGKTPSNTPWFSFHWKGTDTVAPTGHIIPSQGRGSRITFFINQFTPSLNASPPKKEICEGKTTVSSYLKYPPTYQAIPLLRKPQTVHF